MFFLFKSSNTFGQDMRSKLVPGLYFFSQKSSEWVGGGYYLLRPDSTFIMFSPIWQEIEDCGALDIDANHFGTGKWQLKKNTLALTFSHSNNSFLNFESRIIYSSETVGSSDSVYLDLSILNHPEVWFVNVHSIDYSKKVALVSSIKKRVTGGNIKLVLPRDSYVKSLSIESQGYYSEIFDLIMNRNSHSIQVSKLEKKGTECISIEQKGNIEGEIKVIGNQRFSFGSLLEIKNVESEKGIMIEKIKDRANANVSRYLLKFLLTELSKIDK